MTPAWKPLVAAHRRSSAARASWQIVNSVGSYLAVWCLMAWTVNISWWLTVPLALFAGGLLVRVFIIFHDCGHGSFFASKAANDFWGFLTGVLTFTPYDQWRGEHAIHHGSTGNLDRRGVGDVWTMTVREYEEAPIRKRIAYRVARNPIVLFVIAPAFLFLVLQRFPSSGATGRERRSVWWMDLAIAGMVL
ncbi:MAG: fatty acid desaturase, partial [Planctomycetes bacterium]|nr:fatty acid desaturase [Planctomycetota bacterium]